MLNFDFENKTIERPFNLSSKKDSLENLTLQQKLTKSFLEEDFSIHQFSEKFDDYETLPLKRLKTF